MSEANKDQNTDQNAKVTELIGQIRDEFGKNHTDLHAKLDEIEKRREEQKKDLGSIRDEIEAVKAKAQERENTIREIERRNALRLESDPLRKREDALSMLGMITRQAMVRGNSSLDMPTRFGNEREQIDSYMSKLHERATLDETTTAGGYFIPTQLVLDIYDTLEEVSPLLGQVDFQSGVPTKGSGVTLTGRPTLQTARANSDTAMTESDPSFSQWNWDTSEAYIYFPVDNWMLQLSPIEIGRRMIAVARDAYIAGICDWLINADASASYNSETGILADKENIVRMAGTTFASLTNADLRKLMRGVLLRARRMGSFLIGPYAIDLLEDIDRQGKVSVLRETGRGDYICKGKPLVEDEGMPDEDDSAADAAFMGFGDLKTWAVVLAGAGLQIGSDTSVRFNYNQTAFRAVGHLDIVRKPGNTWALLKTKAS